MIVYTPFWETMKKRNLSSYQLVHVYEMSSHTIHRLRHNGGISTALIDKLCGILNCRVEDILLYLPDDSNQIDLL